MDIRGTPLKSLDPCPAPNLDSMDSELNDLSRRTEFVTMEPKSSYSIQEPNQSNTPIGKDPFIHLLSGYMIGKTPSASPKVSHYSVLHTFT